MEQLQRRYGDGTEMVHFIHLATSVGAGNVSMWQDDDKARREVLENASCSLTEVITEIYP